MSCRARHDRQLKQQQPRQDHAEEEEEREPRMKSRQVRRRLHTTSRPFHGRPPLDMAEARREIAAALRTHRAAAATRRSGDQQLPQLQQQHQQANPEISSIQWRRPPVSCDAFFSGHLRDSPPAGFTPAGAGASCSSSSTLRCLAPPVTTGGGIDRLACSLPARPLGLSLSFHGFGGSSVPVHDDAKNSDDCLIIQPSPDSSCSVCASPLAAAAVLSHGGSSQAPADAVAENAPSSRPVPLHPVPEGFYPIGERRGAEWSDDARAEADVATPAWWGDLLDQITEDGGGGKLGSPAGPAGQEGGGAAVGEQGIVTGIGKPDGVLEMHLAAADDDYYHYCHQGDGDGEDITLPCLEIGEIEGWDGEWFFSP